MSSNLFKQGFCRFDFPNVLRHITFAKLLQNFVGKEGLIVFDNCHCLISGPFILITVRDCSVKSAQSVKCMWGGGGLVLGYRLNCFIHFVLHMKKMYYYVVYVMFSNQ